MPLTSLLVEHVPFPTSGVRKKLKSLKLAEGLELLRINAVPDNDIIVDYNNFKSAV